MIKKVDGASMRFNHALWLLMEFNVNRYLMCNAEGRLDGFEKAKNHIELCYIYMAAMLGMSKEKVGSRYRKLFMLIHDNTQYLTGYMDTEIGFPITGRPDYHKLAPLFFTKFIELAHEAFDGQPAYRRHWNDKGLHNNELIVKFELRRHT